jgi:hypothetical protein
MNLTGAVIRSNNVTLRVLRGFIRSFHVDRRKPPPPDAAQPAVLKRRKPPAEVRDLVGTGRLCVVKGELEILAADAARHVVGNVLKLELRDLSCVICSLSDAIKKDKVLRWSFVALFEPTPQQRLWIESLNPTEDQPAAPTVTKRPLPRPPVFMHLHIDEQTEFLRQLAESDPSL